MNLLKILFTSQIVIQGLIAIGCNQTSLPMFHYTEQENEHYIDMLFLNTQLQITFFMPLRVGLIPEEFEDKTTHTIPDNVKEVYQSFWCDKTPLPEQFKRDQQVKQKQIYQIHNKGRSDIFNFNDISEKNWLKVSLFDMNKNLKQIQNYQLEFENQEKCIFDFKIKANLDFYLYDFKLQYINNKIFDLVIIPYSLLNQLRLRQFDIYYFSLKKQENSELFIAEIQRFFVNDQKKQKIIIKELQTNIYDAELTQNNFIHIFKFDNYDNVIDLYDANINQINRDQDPSKNDINDIIPSWSFVSRQQVPIYEYITLNNNTKFIQFDRYQEYQYQNIIVGFQVRITTEKIQALSIKNMLGYYQQYFYLEDNLFNMYDFNALQQIEITYQYFQKVVPSEQIIILKNDQEVGVIEDINFIFLPDLQSTIDQNEKYELLLSSEKQGNKLKVKIILDKQDKITLLREYLKSEEQIKVSLKYQYEQKRQFQFPYQNDMPRMNFLSSQLQEIFNNKENDISFIFQNYNQQLPDIQFDIDWQDKLANPDGNFLIQYIKKDQLIKIINYSSNQQILQCQLPNFYQDNFDIQQKRFIMEVNSGYENIRIILQTQQFSDHKILTSFLLLPDTIIQRTSFDMIINKYCVIDIDNNNIILKIGTIESGILFYQRALKNQNQLLIQQELFIIKNRQLKTRNFNEQIFKNLNEEIYEDQFIVVNQYKNQEFSMKNIIQKNFQQQFHQSYQENINLEILNKIVLGKKILNELLQTKDNISYILTSLVLFQVDFKSIIWIALKGKDNVIMIVRQDYRENKIYLQKEQKYKGKLVLVNKEFGQQNILNDDQYVQYLGEEKQEDQFDRHDITRFDSRFAFYGNQKTFLYFYNIYTYNYLILNIHFERKEQEDQQIQRILDIFVLNAKQIEKQQILDLEILHNKQDRSIKTLNLNKTPSKFKFQLDLQYNLASKNTSQNFYLPLKSVSNFYSTLVLTKFLTIENQSQVKFSIQQEQNQEQNYKIIIEDKKNRRVI